MILPRSSNSTQAEMQQIILRDQSGVPAINLLEALSRQKRIIFLMTTLVCCLAYLYVQNTAPRYTSTAKLMVNQRDTGLVNSPTSQNPSDDLVNEDILANHIELLSSRKNVSSALQRSGLMDLDSILPELDEDKDEDSVDYVISNLKFSRGGRGASKGARTMLLEFQHTDSVDAKLILDCVIEEYMRLIDQQFADSISVANNLVMAAQQEIQTELQAAQQEYIASRKKAPVLFTGDGSSNVFVEQFKTLSNQLIELEIQESITQGRLQKANAVVAEYADPNKFMPIEELGVIDTDSLQRLGVFSNMRADSTKSADFQVNQPERLEEAKTQYNQLLRLMLEKQRLEADFGSGHPDVQKLQQEIDLVKQFLEDNKVETLAELDEPQLTSRQLLGAFVGFLKSELSSVTEQRKELTSRIAFAESQARGLVQYQLQDELLKSKIDRHQLLFDGFVEQLRTLNMASNVDGFVHQLLERPRPGVKIWPKLSIVLAAGVMLGLLLGVFAALVNDQSNSRFKTAQEIDSAVSIPVLGYIKKLPVSRRSAFVPSTSSENESFRLLRTMLLADVRSGELSSLTATSASPADGKSTLLLNIAASFASLKMPVVVVEADMRRPTFRKRLKLKGKTGLSDVLNNTATIEESLCETEVPNLKVIHAGTPVSDPAELLQSEAFDNLMKELRADYVLTVVDVGPILAVSDPLVVAQKVDATLLVVRPSVDTRQQVLGAADRLRAGNVNLLGMLVNAYGSSSEFHDSRYGYDVTYASKSAFELA